MAHVEHAYMGLLMAHVEMPTWAINSKKMEVVSIKWWPKFGPGVIDEFLIRLNEIIELVSTEHVEVLLEGDFNIDLLQTDTIGVNFRNLLPPFNCKASNFTTINKNGERLW